jgi:hypothetical protein
MTTFTLFHTAVSVLPILFGLYALVREGKIDPRARAGKWYLGTMLAGSVSSFGFIPVLGFTPGQVLTLITIALLAVGTLTLRGGWRGPGYVQTIALTTSYLLLMVFATTEALKRLPLSHPFATGPSDPSLIPVRLALLAIYLVVVGYQMLRIHAEHGPVARLERLIAGYRHAA